MGEYIPGNGMKTIGIYERVLIPGLSNTYVKVLKWLSDSKYGVCSYATLQKHVPEDWYFYICVPKMIREGYLLDCGVVHGVQLFHIAPKGREVLKKYPEDLI